LPTNTAAQSIDRIIDSFPSDAKNQLRLQLASSLLAVVTQRLVRRADGKGRALACEVLTRSPTVEKLIIENRIGDLEQVMESSNLYYKMQSMNQDLERLVREGVITREEALLHSDKKEDLELKMSGMVAGSQHGVDANELLQQASEATKVGIRDGMVKQDDFDLVTDDPAASGIQMEGQEQKKKAAAAPGKPAASPAVDPKKFGGMFRKKTA
jgi:hypothetical protein